MEYKLLNIFIFICCKSTRRPNHKTVKFYILSFGIDNFLLLLLLVYLIKSRCENPICDILFYNRH